MEPAANPLGPDIDTREEMNLSVTNNTHSVPAQVKSVLNLDKENAQVLIGTADGKITLSFPHALHPKLSKGDNLILTLSCTRIMFEPALVAASPLIQRPN